MESIRVELHLVVTVDDQIINLMKQILRKEETIMADLTKITADVQAEVDASTAMETLLTNIAAEIRAAGTDQAAVDALATKLEQNSAQIAAITLANTDVAPPATGTGTGTGTGAAGTGTVTQGTGS